MLNLLINLDVPELQEAIGFYQRAFGFALRRRLFAGSVAELGGATVPVYLLARAAGSAPVPGAPQLRDYAPHWTPLHLDLVVADLPTALDRALQAGASLERGPLTEVWGSLALLRDPFGHGWCLLQWHGRGYDEVAD